MLMRFGSFCALAQILALRELGVVLARDVNFCLDN